MNRFTGIGRLTKDPDVRYTAGENPLCIARYTLACDRISKKEGQPTADFISCVAMGKSGEFAEKYLSKGMKIAVEGRIQTGSYDDKDGKKVYTTDVYVERHEFVESRNNQQNASEQSAADGFMPIPDSDLEGLPFA